MYAMQSLVSPAFFDFVYGYQETSLAHLQLSKGLEPFVYDFQETLLAHRLVPLLILTCKAHSAYTVNIEHLHILHSTL
jgi:hypothetical protein